MTYETTPDGRPGIDGDPDDVRGAADRDHTPSDAAASGRHALRDTDSRGDGSGPADPNGPQSPRTEERTR